MRTVIQPESDHEVLSLITNVTYTSVPAWYGFTRRNLMMDIIAPKFRTPDQRHPLVVWFCGGAYRLVDRAVWLPELMHFAREGYIVASVEYRTSNESVFPDALNDAKTAIRYLRAHSSEFSIDPDRIVVMGESAGGTIASLVGTTGDRPEFGAGDHPEYSSAVSGIVDFYGITDMLHNVELPVGDDTPPWTLKDFIGVNYTEEMARKASAVSYVDENTPPVLILHGTNDPLVSPEQSEIFYKVLTEHHVDADLYLLDGAVHGDDLFYQERTQKIVDEFLRKVFR